MASSVIPKGLESDTITLHPVTSANSAVTVKGGGYIKIGRCVIVAISLTLSASINTSTRLVNGLPTNATEGANVIAGTANFTGSARLGGGDGLYSNGTFPSGDVFLTGAYITS